MNNQAQQTYHSYLVRCWLQPPLTAAEHPIWRFQLQDISAEPQTVRFSDLEDLLSYMLARLFHAAMECRQSAGIEAESEGGLP
jgi:hypothetical protein